MPFQHASVLLDEVIENLNIKPDGVYVDGTLGGGGHALAVCERLSEKGRLVGIDQDGDALAAAGGRLSAYKDRVILVRDNYENIEAILSDLAIGKVDGIFLDLGVSSYQLDTAERGFSYRQDAPLDMRMDQRGSLTAADVINTYSEGELVRVLQNYGEERFAKAIARRIIQHREKAPYETTGELVKTIEAAIPAKARAAGGHPAKRTFQAVRIEVNRELTVLENTLDVMAGLLKPGGRLCVITFHSLEDRIVKTKFKTNENPCICPPDFPVCVCGRKSRGRVVTRKPVLPKAEELAENRRAKSAKLRVFERGAEQPAAADFPAAPFY